MTDDFFSDGSHAAIVDAHAFFDSDLPKLIGELVSLGVLISIGSTKDRGAISIRITSDGRSRRDYFRDSSDAADWMGRAVAAVSGTGVATTAGDLPRAQRRTRAH